MHEPSQPHESLPIEQVLRSQSTHNTNTSTIPSRSSTNRAWLGFENLEREVAFDDVPVRGSIPTWLTGALYRNGSGKTDAGQQRVAHWYDGMSLLQRFAFNNGSVSYRNRFLRSNMYTVARETGNIGFKGFATDPCGALLGAMKAEYMHSDSENANINIGCVAGQILALAEPPMAVQFDPVTLETLGTFRPEQFVGPLIPGQTSTPHPQRDFVSNQLINYNAVMSQNSVYIIHSTDRLTGARHIISTLPVSNPAYMHTFSMTEHYVILAEYPLRVNLRELQSGKPFFASYHWHPESPTRFLVVRKNDGQQVATLEAAPFLALHHINAFERGQGPTAELVVDVAAYEDATHITDFYLDKREAGAPLHTGQFRRYTLPLSSTHAEYEVLTSDLIELPTIDYRRRNARAYRYAYGASMRADLSEPMYNQLVKVDVHHRQSTTWFEDGCFPSEGIFVPAPDATDEDDGVLLSMVLDTRTHSSFLLVLDAHTFIERGRAVVPVPVPYSIHGQFLSDDYATI